MPNVPELEDIKKEEVIRKDFSKEEQLAMLEVGLNNAREAGLENYEAVLSSCIILVKNDLAEVFGVDKQGDPIIRATELGREMNDRWNKTLH